MYVGCYIHKSCKCLAARICNTKPWYHGYLESLLHHSLHRGNRDLFTFVSLSEGRLFIAADVHDVRQAKHLSWIMLLSLTTWPKLLEWIWSVLTCHVNEWNTNERVLSVTPDFDVGTTKCCIQWYFYLKCNFVFSALMSCLMIHCFHGMVYRPLCHIYCFHIACNLWVHWKM